VNKHLLPFAFVLVPLAFAQTPPQPATQDPTVRAIRYKLSAADLDSAESLLDEHKTESGVDAVYIVGASWLARGAALARDWKMAERYSAVARELAPHPTSPDLIYALGSAIEVHAQVLEAQGKKREATAFLDDQLKRFSDTALSFRSRLYKRRNMIALVGQPAPLLPAELTKGKPAILFLWANYCGDCLGEEPALARFWQQYRARGVQLAAVTRIYDDDDPAADKAKTAEVWKTSYQGLSDVPVVTSADAILRYGGSSTPTFVFIDATGVVRAYLPYRLTEQRLSEEAEKLFTKTGKRSAP